MHKAYDKFGNEIKAGDIILYTSSGEDELNVGKVVKINKPRKEDEWYLFDVNVSVRGVYESLSTGEIEKKISVGHLRYSKRILLLDIDKIPDIYKETLDIISVKED